MPTPTEFLVRLKPRPSKKRKGVSQTPARYMIKGIRFDEARGWYRITDAEFARELRRITHNDRPDGVLIFDVTTAEHAREIEKEEARSKTRSAADDAQHVQTVQPVSRRTSARANALTTQDATAEPVMLDPDPEGDELESASEDGDDELGEDVIGRLSDGPEQDLDDGDDLLDDDSREPAAPVITSAVPRTRTKVKPSSKPKPKSKR